MPSNVTPVDEWTTNVQVPNAGETANQGAWSIGSQPLTNRTVHLRKGIPGIASSYVIRCPLAAFSLPGANNVWRAEVNPFCWRQYQLTGSDGNVMFHLNVPLHGRIKQVIAVVRGASGHSFLPSAKVNLRLYEQISGATGLTTNWIKTDPSTSVPAYEATHQIVINETDFGGTALPISIAASYYVELEGEQNPNGVAGFRLYDIEVEVIPI